MSDELFWLFGLFLFSGALLFNYIHKKRWIIQSKLERRTFIVLFVLITYINSTTSIFFYEIRESILEGGTVSANAVMNFHYFLNFIYCILILFLAVVLLLNSFISFKFRNKLLYGSYIAIGICFLISLVKFISISNINSSEMSRFLTIYTFNELILLIFLSCYLEHTYSKKTMQVLLILVASVLILLQIFMLIKSNYILQNLLFSIGVALVMFVLVTTKYFKPKKNA